MISSSYHVEKSETAIRCFLCLYVLDLLFPVLLTLRSVTERPSSQPLDDPFLMPYTINEQFQFNICFLLSNLRFVHKYLTLEHHVCQLYPALRAFSISLRSTASQTTSQSRFNSFYEVRRFDCYELHLSRSDSR